MDNYGGCIKTILITYFYIGDSEANLSILPFVADAYKIETMKKMYCDLIVSVPHHSDWCVPPHIQIMKVIPPENVRQAGRPKQRRHLSAGEARIQKCGRCHLPGHNRARCTEIITTATTSSQNANEQCTSQTNRKRAPQRCSICRDQGHTRRCCPNMHVQLSEDEG